MTENEMILHRLQAVAERSDKLAAGARALGDLAAAAELDGMAAAARASHAELAAKAPVAAYWQGSISGQMRHKPSVVVTPGGRKRRRNPSINAMFR